MVVACPALYMLCNSYSFVNESIRLKSLCVTFSRLLWLRSLRAKTMRGCEIINCPCFQIVAFTTMLYQVPKERHIAPRNETFKRYLIHYSTKQCLDLGGFPSQLHFSTRTTGIPFVSNYCILYQVPLESHLAPQK